MNDNANNGDTCVLLIEDNVVDSTLIVELLTEDYADISVDVSPSLKAGRAQFEKKSYELIILDLTLPDSDGLDTFYRTRDFCNETPVLILTATDNEEWGIEAVKNGAQDYLVKWEFNARVLRRSIKYSLERNGFLKEREDLIRRLQKAQKKIVYLEEILPICSHCKKIRDDEGYWMQVEEFMRRHKDLEFSHGICPECAKELYPDYSE